VLSLESLFLISSNIAGMILGEPNVKVTFDSVDMRFMIDGVYVQGVRRFTDPTEAALHATGPGSHALHSKAKAAMPGRWQAIRVDCHFSVLSNQEPLPADLAHRRKSGYHRQRVGGDTNNQIVDHLRRRWEVYSRTPVSILQKMANNLHPFAWQAAEHLVNTGMRPIAGNVPVGNADAKIATAIDGLWWHRAENRFVVVELKKYETDDYVESLQTAHQRQLALTAILFTHTFKSSVHNPPLGVVLRVHESGPTLYWLQPAGLAWAKTFLTQRLATGRRSNSTNKK
jgi:hypothetical protein